MHSKYDRILFVFRSLSYKTFNTFFDAKRGKYSTLACNKYSRSSLKSRVYCGNKLWPITAENYASTCAGNRADNKSKSNYKIGP